MLRNAGTPETVITWPVQRQTIHWNATTDNAPARTVSTCILRSLQNLKWIYWHHSVPLLMTTQLKNPFVQRLRFYFIKVHLTCTFKKPTTTPSLHQPFLSDFCWKLLNRGTPVYVLSFRPLQRVTPSIVLVTIYVGVEGIPHMLTKTENLCIIVHVGMYACMCATCVCVWMHACMNVLSFFIQIDAVSLVCK